MNFPTDPIRQNDRLIKAICDDLLDTGRLSLDGPKTSRVAEIIRQTNKSQSPGGNE